MKFFNWLKAFLIITYVPVQSAVATDSITIGVHNYPPYYNKDAKGLLVDLYTAAFKEVGIDAKFMVLPIKRFYKFIENGKIDAFSPGSVLIPEKERKEQLVEVEAFHVTASFFYFKENKIKYTNMKDIIPYKIAIIDDSPYEPLYQMNHLHTRSLGKIEQLVEMAVKGRVDLFESTLLSGLLVSKQLSPKLMLTKMKYIIWDQFPAFLAFNKNRETSVKLKEKFVIGLDKIIKNGTYIKILENYWGKGNILKSSLIDELKKYGTNDFDANLFLNYTRDASGKIIAN